MDAFFNINYTHTTSETGDYSFNQNNPTPAPLCLWSLPSTLHTRTNGWSLFTQLRTGAPEAASLSFTELLCKQQKDKRRLLITAGKENTKWKLKFEKLSCQDLLCFSSNIELKCADF